MKKIIVEIFNAFYDLLNFLKYSFKETKLKNKNHYSAFLTKQYHIIEKGLSLSEPRLGFGEQKILNLMNVTSDYVVKFGEDDLSKNIVNVLEEYVNFNLKKGFNSDLIDKIQLFISNKDSNLNSAGIRDNYISNISYDNYKDFVTSRSSVRNFKNKEVSDMLILKALDIAKYTPSVCNRQGWKMHVYKGDKALEMLTLQNGNRGFSESIARLVIVTGDINYFSQNERNQIGIDGGMFSMSFLYSLHSLGLGACALNTCVSLKTEEKIKKLGEIPKWEKLIMYIAVGFPEDNCKVAISDRRETQSFITIH